MSLICSIPLKLQARKYVERISELTEVPLGIVSVGPNRSQTIILHDIF